MSYYLKVLPAALGLVLISQEVSAFSAHYPGLMKREMTPQGFYGDTFSDGFGGFRTMKKSQPDQDIEASLNYAFSKF